MFGQPFHVANLSKPQTGSGNWVDSSGRCLRSMEKAGAIRLDIWDPSGAMGNPGLGLGLGLWDCCLTFMHRDLRESREEVFGNRKADFVLGTKKNPSASKRRKGSMLYTLMPFVGERGGLGLTTEYRGGGPVRVKRGLESWLAASFIVHMFGKSPIARGRGSRMNLWRSASQKRQCIPLTNALDNPLENARPDTAQSRHRESLRKGHAR
ncbi:hypothetical protein B0T19DRAFT_133430 [Cercophora scortea]|uniref:Uncharacterized protein n=1 Tax=Cercophora scortea TaxID=314031 RepID=A0AAE0MIG6_9PEZI|nr:hypothetical protein B0T19DRAFT_133430 [Cercophora scortea]